MWFRKYLYKYSCSHQNKSLILEKIKQFNVDLNESDVYDTLTDFDPIKEELDLEFYNEYHEDIKTLLLPEKNTNKLNEEYLKEHWESCGKKKWEEYPILKLLNLMQIETIFSMLISFGFHINILSIF